MSRLLPFPLATAGLFALWLLLNQALSLGHVLLGGAIALIGGWALTALAAAEGPNSAPSVPSSAYHLWC